MSEKLRKLEIEYLANTAERLTALVGMEGFAFLDSCPPKIASGRWDIIVAQPRVQITTVGSITKVRIDHTSYESDQDPLSIVQQYLEDYPAESTSVPFHGGALGYFAYDLGRRFETLPTSARNDFNVPEMSVGIYDWAGIVDHQCRQAWVVAPDASREDLEKWAGMLEYKQPLTPAAFPTSFQVVERATPDISFTEYAQQFAKIKEYIRNGDCYQVNYAQRFTAGVEGHSWDAYRRLRNLNAAPFSAVFINQRGGNIEFLAGAFSKSQ